MEQKLTRSFLSLLVGTGLILSALAGGLAGPVLCRHSDGSAAIESGNDRCCVEAGEDAHRDRPPAGFAASAGRCPGCSDSLLPGEGPRTTAPSKLLVANPAMNRATCLARDPGLGSMGSQVLPLVADTDPPPGILPLRI